jgi:hypothetical protein
MEAVTNSKKKPVPIKSPVTQNIQSDTSTLPELLKQFISIQANISELKSQTKALVLTSKHLESKILNIMQEQNLQNIDTQLNSIQIKTTTVRKQINQTLLTDFFGSKLNISQSVIQQFLDQVPTKTTHALTLKQK